ncbi:MAG: glycosyltransferase family 32 protein [Anaerolineae bacterium]
MRAKTLFIFSLSLATLIGGAFLFHRTRTSHDLSFERLMGNHSKHWRHVQNPKDLQELAFYKALYEKNKPFLNRSNEKLRIPQVIHFIWLGPKPFPDTSKKNIRSWMNAHKGWVVKFWTDDPKRICPVDGMQKELLQNFNFQFLEGFLEKTQNFGEKSDLWRYEILYQQGGVYVDHDVKCYRSFEDLGSNFDFFCGLEKPHPVSGIPTSIMPAICLVGSAPSHAILKTAMQQVKDCWEKTEKEFAASPRWRVVNRTFKSFNEALKKEIDREDRRDIVLPASYFFAHELFAEKTIRLLKKRGAIFAKHYWEGEWQREESRDLGLIKKIKKLEKRQKGLENKVIYLLLVFIFLILSASIGRVFSIKAKRHKNTLSSHDFRH